MTTTNDEADPLGSAEAGPAPDQPPRTVAEEAALLVDLLSRRGWGAGAGMPSASAHTPADAAARAATSAPEGAPEAHDHAHAGRTDDGARPGGIPLGDGRQGPECTCGGREPAACRMCPVCQLISFVQQVNPDTIERVADFVGFAATALRDLATSQRERSERSETSETSERSSAPVPPGDATRTQPTARPEATRDDTQEDSG